MANSNVQSEMDVESNPVIPGTSALAQPHVWSWIWFGVSVLTIFGFHVRVFGRAVPPAARFP